MTGRKSFLIPLLCDDLGNKFRVCAGVACWGLQVAVVRSTQATNAGAGSRSDATTTQRASLGPASDHARPDGYKVDVNTRTQFPSKIVEHDRIRIDQSPEPIIPRTAMSLSFWAQACATALDKPLQAQLDSAYASCGVTVSLAAAD